jgi:hypothetical protein
MIKRIPWLCCALFLLTGNLPLWQSGFSKPAGPYLGQRPPGLTPELFAPGIVSTGLDELNSAISPDGREFYYCVRNAQGASSIFQMKWGEGGWSGPRLLPWASRFGDIDACVSPAGDRILFSSLRPPPGSTEPRRDNDFWMASRRGNSWGEAVHLGAGINSDSQDYYPTMTRSGTIYFSSQREGPGSNNIYRADPVAGAYPAAVKLGEAVNTQYREFDPYVSPDEGLLIFASNRPGGQGGSDLYISFREAGGAWTDAVNLGKEINSPGPEFSPMLSPDGKYLFFTSYRFERGRVPETPLDHADFCREQNLPGNGLGDIYWVDARIIEKLRPRAAATRISGPAGKRRIALATYAADEEQVRAVRALARSVRERGGAYASSPFYLVSSDPGNTTAEALKGLGVELLPLAMADAFRDYPLAIKAFAAAQVERKVEGEAGTLVWLDPGTLVLGTLAELDLDESHDAALRPVTLANTIGIPPQSEPNDYWRPIYAAIGLDYRTLAPMETIADRVEIQPYYNCEVFSFNPRLGIAAEWTRLLTRFLKDASYQKKYCNTFLRRLFLHQAVLSAVIASKVKAGRIRPLPLASGYPFSQHSRLPEARRVSRLDDISVVIFDRAWAQDGKWLERIPAGEALKKWLLQVYHDTARE